MSERKPSTTPSTRRTSSETESTFATSPSYTSRLSPRSFKGSSGRPSPTTASTALVAGCTAHANTACSRTRSLTPKFGVLLVGIRGNLNPRLSIREINMKEGQPVEWLLVVPVANLVVPVANAQLILYALMSSPSRLPDKLLARSLYSFCILWSSFSIFSHASSVPAK